MFWFLFQRSEIIYSMADLLTEKREEILSANKKDMELAVNSGILDCVTYWINPDIQALSQMDTPKSCVLPASHFADTIKVQDNDML